MKEIRKSPTFPADIPVSDVAVAVDDLQEIRDAQQIEENGGEATLYDESAAELDAEVLTGSGESGVSASQIAERFLRGNVEAESDQFVYAEDRGIVLAFPASVGRWLKDTGDKRNMTHYLFRKIRALCLQVYAESNLRRDWKAHLRSAYFPASVVSIVVSELEHVKFADTFDANPDLLGLPNGKVWELQTGISRAQRPGDSIAKQTGVTPDPTQKPTRFLQFLDEISRHNRDWIEYILRCLGYFCTGRMDERYLGFFTGVTSNGKSILCDLIVSILGDYAATTSVKSLASGSAESSEQEMRLFGRLCGARVVFASESNASLKIDIGLAKKLASKEKLTGRFLFENPFEYIPTFKTVISAQELAFEKIDAAIQARLQVCHFPQVFAQPKDMHRFVDALPADLQLGAKLERERAAILALMLDYAKRWYVDGLQPPACIVASTDKYFASTDDFGQWLDTRCAREKDTFTPGNVLFADYQGAAGEMGMEPMKRDAFSKKLIAAGFKDDRARVDGCQVRGFHGLRLRERDEDGDTGNE